MGQIVQIWEDNANKNIMVLEQNFPQRKTWNDGKIKYSRVVEAYFRQANEAFR